MRTRILPKMLNAEVQEYLKRNDIIIVPVGTVVAERPYTLPPLLFSPNVV